MPVIRETTRRWLEGHLEELARALHDRRYELGLVTACLRDPQVENVDVNGCDQQSTESPTRKAGLGLCAGRYQIDEHAGTA
jgi:hypothetical protein